VFLSRIIASSAAWRGGAPCPLSGAPARGFRFGPGRSVFSSKSPQLETWSREDGAATAASRVRASSTLALPLRVSGKVRK